MKLSSQLHEQQVTLVIWCLTAVDCCSVPHNAYQLCSGSTATEHIIWYYYTRRNDTCIADWSTKQIWETAGCWWQTINWYVFARKALCPWPLN